MFAKRILRTVRPNRLFSVPKKPKRKIVLDDDAIMGKYQFTNPDITPGPLSPEEINSLKNERIIKREFLNDAVGITLKSIALYFAGPQ